MPAEFRLEHPITYMQVFVIVSFLVVLTAPELGAGDIALSPAVALSALGVYWGVAAGLAAFRGRRLAGRLIVSGGADRSAVRRLGLAKLLSHFWLVGGLAGLMVAGGAYWVGQTGLGRWPLVGDLLAWLPFAVGLLLTWLLDYPASRAVQHLSAQSNLMSGRPAARPWTLGEYIGFNLRHHVLFALVPVGTIVFLTESVEIWFVPMVADPVYQHLLLGGSSLLAAGSVFLLAPAAVVRIWRTRPLPPGPLRDDLDALCRRLGIRYRQLRLWQTGGQIANAGVMGVLPQVRYILLTDALLEHLDRRRVLAVFAHEAGHVLAHHIAYFVVFAISSIVLCTYAAEWMGHVLGLGGPWRGILALAAMVACWALVFGWISRQFERESDVVGAWAAEWLTGQDDQAPEDTVTVEGATTFASALEELSELNGMPRRRFNWRHGTIHSRVDYLLQLAGRGGGRSEAHRRARGIRRGLLATAAVSAALLAANGLGWAWPPV